MPRRRTTAIESIVVSTLIATMLLAAVAHSATGLTNPNPPATSTRIVGSLSPSLRVTWVSPVHIRTSSRAPAPGERPLALSASTPPQPITKKRRRCPLRPGLRYTLLSVALMMPVGIIATCVGNRASSASASDSNAAGALSPMVAPQANSFNLHFRTLDGFSFGQVRVYNDRDGFESTNAESILINAPDSWCRHGERLRLYVRAQRGEWIFVDAVTVELDGRGRPLDVMLSKTLHDIREVRAK
ncbi:MAG: hypothetical protein KF912_14610 [Phycisphaeraceae bacterium]|nr:hypothetical protein [Phycisphaeraceae bacterium]